MNEVKTNIINLFGARAKEETPIERIERRLNRIDNLLDELKEIEQKNLTNKERMERERAEHNRNLTRRLNLKKDK